MDEGEEAWDGFSDWEQIQVLTLSTHSTAPPMVAPPGEPDMVATEDSNNNNSHRQSQHQHDLSVFLPSSHEGLEITSAEEQPGEEEGEQQVHIRDESEVNSSVASWPSTNVDEANSGPLKKANEIGKILTNGIVKLAARVRYYMDFRGGIWSFGAISGVLAALLLSFVYAKVRNWRAKVKEEKKDRLVFLIQEKDQKINRLLVQIAQMNELISTRRRVPVLRLS